MYFGYANAEDFIGFRGFRGCPTPGAQFRARQVRQLNTQEMRRARKAGAAAALQIARRSPYHERIVRVASFSFSPEHSQTGSRSRLLPCREGL